jgi:hypothetical protein
MALTTGYSSTGAFLDTGIGIARIHGDIVYNVTRSDNTVSFTSTYARIKYVRESGSWTSFYYGAGWAWRLYIGTSTQRSSNSLSGTRYVDDVDNGTSVSFNITVDKDDTTYIGRIGAWFDGDAQTYTAAKTLDIPDLGSPSLSTQSASSIAVTTATVTATAAAGTNSSGVASIQLQYGLTTGYGTNSTDSSSPYTWALTGLTPGSTYHYRFVITNNGGKTTTTGDYTFTTLPAPNTSAALLNIVGVL